MDDSQQDTKEEALEIDTGVAPLSLEESDTVELESGETLVRVDNDDAQEANDEQKEPTALEDTMVGAGDTMLALQGIINRQSARLDVLKEQVKQLNEGVKNILENDAELAIAEEQMKEVSRRQKARKQTLAQSAESVQLKYKMQEIRDQVKDLEESLNNHLLNYYQLTGTKFFDTDEGEQREFEVRAKLRSKGKKPTKHS